MNKQLIELYVRVLTLGQRIVSVEEDGERLRLVIWTHGDYGDYYVVSWGIQ